MKRKDFSNLDISVQITKEKIVEQENYSAGSPPFVRGIHSTMYLQKPLKHVVSPNFSTDLINKKLLIIELLNNQSYHSVEDFKVVFDKIPLNKITVTIPLNIKTLPVLAFYIATAKEKGIDQKLLSGIFKKNILINSLFDKIIDKDVIEYTEKHLPKFKLFTVIDCQIETTAPIEQKLACALVKGLEFIKSEIFNGKNIDEVASKIILNWNISNNHFNELATLRAARLAWAKLLKQFNPKKQESLALPIHCNTTNTLPTMSALFGGTQSLNNQEKTLLYLQEETSVLKTIDPWAGSTFVEEQTIEIALKTLELIQKIELLGGLTKAIKSGSLIISKILKDDYYKATKEIDLKSSPKKVRKLKEIRNTEQAKKALENLSNCVKTGKGNLVELTVIAAEKRATLNEIYTALQL